MTAHEPYPSRCDSIPVCVPCPHPPFTPNQSGPDVPGVECWTPNGCCLPSACAVDELEFMCAVRALLPEGDVYNNTRGWAKDPATNVGVITIGCARIGCEQLIFGGCCDDAILCDDDPVAPQLAVVDAYAASVYRVIQAMCAVTREIDPCTSVVWRRRWADRLGFDPKWSDNVLAHLLCVWPRLKRLVWNWWTVHEVGAMFGSAITIRQAGDFSNCGPPGWWTMARDRNDDRLCAYLQIEACPPESEPMRVPLIRFEASCAPISLSLNVIFCPADNIVLPDDCSAQGDKVLPFDPEIYAAFKQLLPRLLAHLPVFFCYYECSPAECIQ